MKNKHEKKMVEVIVRYWTNGISDFNKNLAPEWKLAHDSGVIYIKKGPGHKRVAPMHFHRESEIPAVIDDVLTKAGILLLGKHLLIADPKKKATS